MSKKSRKSRKLDRNDRRGKNAPATAKSTPSAALPPLAERVVAEVVQQIATAVEDVANAAIGSLEPSAVSDEPEAENTATAEEAEEKDARDNRRHHPRVALAVEIDLSSGSHFFSGLSGDLSEGGVFVETYRDIPVGSEVALEFDLPNGSVTAHGSVKWHRDHSDSSPPGVGVSFDDLSEEGKEIIVAFCSKRAPLYYDVASP
jgi:uncharacterized protein (TIGR02266 family)